MTKIIFLEFIFLCCDPVNIVKDLHVFLPLDVTTDREQIKLAHYLTT